MKSSRCTDNFDTPTAFAIRLSDNPCSPNSRTLPTSSFDDANDAHLVLP